MGSPSLTPTLMCLLICETVGFSVFHVAFRATLNASGWRVLSFTLVGLLFLLLRSFRLGFRSSFGAYVKLELFP